MARFDLIEVPDEFTAPIGSTSELTLNRYASARAADFLPTLCDLHSVDRDATILDSGADGVLNLVFRHYSGQRQRFAIPSPSYAGFKFFADRYACDYFEYSIPALPNLMKIWSAESAHTVLIICHPMNPTGGVTPELATSILNYPGAVVVDEAYIDFAPDQSVISAIRQRKADTLVVRTFSKGLGAAGIRLGYGIGNSQLISSLRSYQLPYPVSDVALQIGLVLLGDLERAYQRIRDLQLECQALRHAAMGAGFYCTDSVANFFSIVSHDHDFLCALQRSLQIQGKQFPLFSSRISPESYLRVSVGSRLHNEFVRRQFAKLAAHPAVLAEGICL